MTDGHAQPSEVRGAPLTALLVGTGGGIAKSADAPRRNGPAVVVTTGGATILFDTGRNVLDGLFRVGIEPASITHLVFTHYHSDHTVGLPDLVLSTWVATGRSRWRIFGPPGARHLWHGLFGETGAFRPDIDARVQGAHSRQLFFQRLGMPLVPPDADIIEIPSDGFVVDEPGWRLEASFAPDHVQPHLISVAYRVTTPAGSVVVTGDTGPSEAIARFARGADLLVHDCTIPSRDGTYERGGIHTDPEGLGRVAAAAGVKAVVGTHVTPARDRPEVLDRYPELVARSFAGTFRMAVDGLAISVSPDGLRLEAPGRLGRVAEPGAHRRGEGAP